MAADEGPATCSDTVLAMCEAVSVHHSRITVTICYPKMDGEGAGAVAASMQV